MMRVAEYQIRLTQKAKEDIEDISRYITFELSEPGISKKFIQNLRKSIFKLLFFPYEFPFIQDDILKIKEIRCMPYKNYYVFYKIIEELHTVIIIRIGYMRRNWRRILQK